MSRIFLALDVPGEHRQRLQLIWPQPAEGLRPARPDQLHLTLHFLGDLDDSDLHRLLKTVGDVPFSPFPVRISGVGRFPVKGKPAVLWAGVEPSPPLMALHASLSDTLEAGNFPVEHRRYTPHVTLARVTARTPRKLSERFLADHASLALPPWHATQFVVYESRLFDGHSEHVKLATVACST